MQAAFLHIASPWVQIITYLSLCFHTAACQSVLPPPAQIGAVWKQPLPVPCGSNWLGLKKPLYQWSWSESWAADCRQPTLFITLRNWYSRCSFHIHSLFTHSSWWYKQCAHETDTMICICNYNALHHNNVRYLVSWDGFTQQNGPISEENEKLPAHVILVRLINWIP